MQQFYCRYRFCKSQAEPRLAEYKIILPQQDALGKEV